jgi:hypothetical protein
MPMNNFKVGDWVKVKDMSGASASSTASVLVNRIGVIVKISTLNFTGAAYAILDIEAGRKDCGGIWLSEIEHTQAPSLEVRYANT